MSHSTKQESMGMAFFKVTFAYVLAVGLGIAAGYWASLESYSPIWVAAIGDLVATIVIFIFSYLWKNSSMYDPYWSVIPMVIVGYFAWLGWENGSDQTRILLVSALVAFWAIRLTFNWARGWQGMGHEDWRYLDFKAKIKTGYWPFSFLTFHLFPTVMVFLGCLACYPALSIPNQGLNWLDFLAVAVTFMGVMFEMVADNQRYRFAKQPENRKKTITTGLWGISRHPNYFGEISFWVGLFLFALAADPSYWWTGIGCLAMYIMFQFGTLPMMERRNLARRPDYAEVMKRVPQLIPWFPKG